MQAIDLAMGHEIELPGEPIRHAHFLESGFASIVIGVGRGHSDIGLVGREGMFGLPAALGTDVAGYLAVVRQPARALIVDIGTFKKISAKSPAIGTLVLRFVQAQIAQLAYTTVAAQMTTTLRLARWLLMAHDRVDGDTLRITHNDLAKALNVRRPGITVALHDLEGERAIRSKRNALTILDRDKLTEMVGPAYGSAEAAYEQLIGVPLAPVNKRS